MAAKNSKQPWFSRLFGGREAAREEPVGNVSLDTNCYSPAALCQPAHIHEASQRQIKFQEWMLDARLAEGEGEWRRAAECARRARDIPGYETAKEALDLWNRIGLHLPRVALRAALPVRKIDARAGKANSVCMSRDGRWILSGNDDQTARLWDALSGECVRIFKGHTNPITSVCLSEDGRWALSAGGAWYGGSTKDCTLRLWEVATGLCVRIFYGHESPVNTVSLSGDGRWALSGSGSHAEYLRGDNTVRLWEVSSGRCVRTIQASSPVQSVYLSRDGRWALGSGMLHMWEVSTARCVRSFGHGANSVWLSGDGRWALSGDGMPDNALALWDVSSGRCLRILKGHTWVVSSVCLSADGRWALSGSSDKTVRLWNLRTGRCVQTLEGHTASVESVYLSEDCRWALSSSADGAILCWELDWELEARESADWDNGARPFLVNFLTLHTPYAASLPPAGDLTPAQIEQALTRRGKPKWTEDNFADLIHTLGCAGYGWLRPEGVKKKLEKMASGWNGPPQNGLWASLSSIFRRK